MPEQRLTVACPTCKKNVEWTSSNPYRPFCCERCKLIDLGEWADERKAIPGEPVDNPSDTGESNYFEPYPH